VRPDGRRVAERTASGVLQVIEELGYQPNTLAQGSAPVGR